MKRNHTKDSRLFLLFLYSFGIIFFLLTLFFGGSAFSEGTKVLSIPGKTPITVPELAPEFLKWDAVLLVKEDYPNGNFLAVTQSISPDERTVVISLVGKQNDKIIILGFAVKYTNSKNSEFEIYEDLGFLKTGKPTGVFYRVDKASPTAAFKFYLTNTKI